MTGYGKSWTAMGGPATYCRDVLVEHPDALVTKIMAWLGVVELGRCMRTCKEWNRRGSTEELWWALCSSRWASAKLADGPWHKRWATISGRFHLDPGPVGQAAGPTRPPQGDGRRQLLIACPPMWVLPGAKDELADSKWWVRPSALAEVLTWRGSLKASVVDLKRTQITDQELAGSTWALRFRVCSSPCNFPYLPAAMRPAPGKVVIEKDVPWFLHAGCSNQIQN